MEGLLRSLRVDDLPCEHRGNTVTINSTASLEEGFTALVKNQILSAPVYDSEHKQFVGFLDMRDLISVVVHVCALNHQPRTLTEILELGKEHFKQPTGGVTVTYLARRNPFVPVKVGASVWDAIEALNRSSNSHRVPVVDGNRVLQIVSQSSVNKLLALKVRECGDLMNMTVEQLHLGSTPVVCASSDLPAIGTFKLMDDKNLSGVAVTQDGRLSGNVSARDVKQFISKPDFGSLLMSTGDFLKKIRQEQIEIHSPTISVFPHTTVGHVIEKLAATSVHRVYVVNNEKSYNVVAVVSLTDIIRKIWRYHQHPAAHAAPHHV